MKNFENAVAFEEGLWRIEDGRPRLIGSVCEACGEVYFPQKEVAVCSNCQDERVVERLLAPQGVITSYTVVYQAPAGGFYKGHVPFICAIVEFPDGVHVMGHVIGIEPDDMKIGMAVEVVLDELYAEGEATVVAYKFAPLGQEG